MIADWLDDVGIRMQPEVVGETGMNEHWGKGDYDAYIWYWYGDPDPDFQLSIFTTGQCGGWSDGCFSDPAFDALYEEQRSVLDRAERREVVYDAQRYLYEQIPGSCCPTPVAPRRSEPTGSKGGPPHPAPTGTSSTATGTTSTCRSA